MIEYAAGSLLPSVDVVWNGNPKIDEYTTKNASATPAAATHAASCGRGTPRRTRATTLAIAPNPTRAAIGARSPPPPALIQYQPTSCTAATPATMLGSGEGSSGPSRRNALIGKPITASPAESVAVATRNSPTMATSRITGTARLAAGRSLQAR